MRRRQVVSARPQIRANGGLVRRADGDGAVEIILVHRPAYDDWTFPKGKPFSRESDDACAVREVEEETGLRCVPGHELRSVSYRDLRGRPTVVRYWEMVAASVVGVLDDFCRWGQVS